MCSRGLSLQIGYSMYQVTVTQKNFYIFRLHTPSFLLCFNLVFIGINKIYSKLGIAKA